MITTVLCQHPGWSSRSDAEIRQRLGLIERDGNLLHGFAPLSPPRRKNRLRLAHRAKKDGSEPPDVTAEKPHRNRCGSSEQDSPTSSGVIFRAAPILSTVA